MKPVFQKLGNDYPKLKKALMFLTNNLSVSSLREFRFTTVYSLCYLDPIMKLLLVNKELETLTIEMAMITFGKMVPLITQLPKLKYLKITHTYNNLGAMSGYWRSWILENFERSGCVIEVEGF